MNLVARYFVINPMLYTKVHYIDNDRTNNYFQNLMWIKNKKIIK